MPKLSYPGITAGRAVDVLIRVYRGDRDFMKELARLRSPYSAVIKQAATEGIRSGFTSQLPPDEYFLKVTQLIRDGKQSSVFTSQGLSLIDKLQPYVESLDKLAYKWKFRRRGAAIILLVYDMWDALGILDVEVDLPLEAYEHLYPWGPPLPSLQLTVPAWALILEGRVQLMKMISERLLEYENQLKAAGLSEQHTRLRRHAKWWFEHFVHGKTYDDITQEECYTPGGSLISYARNVGASVREFSKLVEIPIKGLK